MPWNEPGNSSNKDPWTGRSKQNPPDLEAFLRDLRKKIVALFKSKTFNKSKTTLTKTLLPTQLNTKLLGLIFSFLILAWLFSGFFTVAPSEQAVITLFGKYHTTLSPGRHWIFRPVEARTIISEKNIDYTYQTNILTRDENKVSIVTKIHYTITNPRQYLFSNTQPLQSLQEAIANASNQTLGKLPLEQLLTTHLFSLQQTLYVKINKLLSLYATGLALSDIELQPIQVPDELKASFDAFNQAQTEKEQLENQAKAYAMQIEPKTQAEAEQLLEDAKNYQQKIISNAKTETARFLALLPAYEASPALTRKRLYLATMQTIMLHSNKMLINTPNNISLSLNSGPSIMPPAEKTKNTQTTEKPTAENPALLNGTSANTNNTLPSSYNITGGYE